MGEVRIRQDAENEVRNFLKAAAESAEIIDPRFPASPGHIGILQRSTGADPDAGLAAAAILRIFDPHVFVETDFHSPQYLFRAGFDAVPTSRAQMGIEPDILCLTTEKAMMDLHALPPLQLRYQGKYADKL
ncbi:MAG TPA: hypothetical protein VLZ89_01740 [Anaerolineales bacterium]|nr:hypothetical protein [Anaerolineales bacterium]